MEDYLKKAIERGDAFDAYKNPEKVREIAEERIGFMRDVFTDIDDVVEHLVNAARESGVVYYADLESSVYQWQMMHLSRYLKIILTNFKKNLK